MLASVVITVWLIGDALNLSQKNGFINDLSILDLLFNCGPNTLDYIKMADL